MSKLQSDRVQQRPGWGEAKDQWFQQINNTRVRVLVWGPSATWPEYAKRRAIIDHLRAENSANDVTTSEELMADGRFSDMHLHDAELVHVQLSDVVILLVVKNKYVTGVQAEVAVFRQRRVFTDKAYLIVPKLSVNRGKSFLAQGWVDYRPSERKLPYSDKEFKDCTTIRAFCSAAVKEARTRIQTIKLQMDLPSL